MFGVIRSWWNKRALRRLREGDEFVLWHGCDDREDRMVADMSRIGEGLVGVRRRRWGTLGVLYGMHGIPEYGKVEYLPAGDLRKPGSTADGERQPEKRVATDEHG